MFDFRLIFRDLSRRSPSVIFSRLLNYWTRSATTWMCYLQSFVDFRINWNVYLDRLYSISIQSCTKFTGNLELITLCNLWHFIIAEENYTWSTEWFSLKNLKVWKSVDKILCDERSFCRSIQKLNRRLPTRDVATMIRRRVRETRKVYNQSPEKSQEDGIAEWHYVEAADARRRGDLF